MQKCILLLWVLVSVAWATPVATPPLITKQPVSQTVATSQIATFSVLATGTPAPIYQWRRNGVNISGATSANYTTKANKVSDSGAIFSVIISNSAGSVTSSEAILKVINIWSKPVITTQPTSKTVVAGQKVSFKVVASGTPAPSYQWYQNGVIILGATSDNYTIPTTDIRDNDAQFSVVVKNLLGSQTSSVANLNISSMPTITIQPTSQTCIANQSASFRVGASGSPEPRFQWRRNGINIVGASENSYTISTTSADDNGANYSVMVFNSVGSVISEEAPLNVWSIPVITSNPVGSTVTEGNSAYFSVVASGTPAPTYQWQKNNLDIPGATGVNFTTPSLSSHDDGARYTVNVKNTVGSVSSIPAILTVLSGPAILAQPSSITVLNGKTAHFTVEASGNPPPSYQWFKNDAIIVGATSASYVIDTIGTEDDGSKYYVKITNPLASINSLPATVAVWSYPVITMQPQSQTVLTGKMAAFSVEATGNPAPSFQWFKNNVEILGASSGNYTTPIISTHDHGAEFSVHITNSVATAISSNATLTVDEIFSTNVFIDKLFGVKTSKNIIYGTGNVRKPIVGIKDLLLDIYTPTGKTPSKLPAIIFIHGGGFEHGSKDDKEVVKFCKKYTERGYVTLSIDYRLTKDDSPNEPGMMPSFLPLTRAMNAAAQDACKAIRWLRTNAEIYKVDPNRIVLGGGSAGATTAMYVGYQNANPSKSKIGSTARVQAIIDLWGGMTGDENLIIPGAPPISIIHGDADSTSSVNNAYAIANQCKKVGVGFNIQIVPGAGHSCFDDIWTGEVNGKTRDLWNAEFLYGVLNLRELLTNH